MALNDEKRGYILTVLDADNMTTKGIWSICGNRFASKHQLREELNLMMLEGLIDRMKIPGRREFIWTLPNS